MPGALTRIVNFRRDFVSHPRSVGARRIGASSSQRRPHTARSQGGAGGGACCGESGAVRESRADHGEERDGEWDP
jgi:hypothetical protein